MKSSGMIRALDDLGRIVLPKEMRRTLGIKERDFLEITVEGDAIVLKKHEINCLFCGSDKDLTTFKGKLICSDCMEELNNN